MSNLGTPPTDRTTGKPPHRRRWIPVSVKVFVGIVLILGAASALRFAIPAWRQHAAVREIRRVGGIVLNHLDGPRWAGRLFGDDWVTAAYEVTEIDCCYAESKFTDVEMAYVGQLDGLENLNLCGTNVT